MTKEEVFSTVWVVDDDRAIRWVLSRALTRADISCRTFASGDEALAAVRSAGVVDRPAVIVSDIRMPGLSGVDLLKALKSEAKEIPVIIMTAYSDLDSAVSAFEGGAFEYLTKPFDVEKAVELISRAVSESASRRAAAGAKTIEEGAEVSVPELIGRAPAMQDVFRAIGRLSQSSVTVLLTGESGAGKEVVARALWKHSPRRNAPYVAINMAAIPRDLLESELFGHEKGAFTGATSTRIGRFEQARGGTLFLDEIGDMPMELQTRLLRVLSSGSFYRVGGREPIRSDVRVIAATNRDLEASVREGVFREDLYHRLNVIRLRLPPLRERREDIGPLARHFLTSGAKELGVEAKVLAPEALEALEHCPFPGNVRQLENICRWLLVMAPSREVRLEDLPSEVRTPGDMGMLSGSTEKASGVLPAHADTGGWRGALAMEIAARLSASEPDIWKHVTEEVERILIESALESTHGRRVEAAERLGVGRNTLTRKLHAQEKA